VQPGNGDQVPNSTFDEGKQCPLACVEEHQFLIHDEELVNIKSASSTWVDRR
jgi:hypothetical protein